MTDTTPPAPPRLDPSQISPEFFVRVNDFIQMANRIERRLDTHHAQIAMLHAFARYSAHHYRTSAKTDDAANREAFAEYIGAALKQLVVGHLEDIAGVLPTPETPNDAPAE